MSPLTRAYVALGSNLGDSLWTLRGALTQLAALPGVSLVAQSSFHSSEPAGGPADQPDYWNSVVALDTQLDAESLLGALHGIEEHFGRDRSQEVRWGPRTLDLDLLLFGDECSNTERLELPHPRLAERRFVLEPLAELAPELRLSNGRMVKEQCAYLLPALHQ
ncbi:MAG: 2-amino-4-hydroxy-6-hydroxymethyldihydropteridine diphosphokinase [Candidatus Paceibacteria bacterium]|jgi:2-amino-4-hydroxy-6-hydroxymethyldihydropteridine diphosphokinase